MGKVLRSLKDINRLATGLQTALAWRLEPLEGTREPRRGIREKLG